MPISTAVSVFLELGCNDLSYKCSKKMCRGPTWAKLYKMLLLENVYCLRPLEQNKDINCSIGNLHSVC